MRMCKWSINRSNITSHVLLNVHRIKMNFKRIEVQQSEKKNSTEGSTHSLVIGDEFQSQR